MKRLIKTGFIGVVMLIFFAACNPNIGRDVQSGSGGGASLPSTASWLKGTWSGPMTVSANGYSTSDYITMRFDDDGLQSASGDYLSGLDITVSYSSDMCVIHVSGTVTSSGTRATASGTYTLKKTGSDSCSLSGSVRASASGYTMNISISGTLHR